LPSFFCLALLALRLVRLLRVLRLKLLLLLLVPHGTPSSAVCARGLPDLALGKTSLRPAFEVGSIGDSLGKAEERGFDMATETEGRGSGVVRKLVVPAAIGLAGSAAGLLMTQRQKVREAAPKLRDAVSDRLPVPQVPGGGVGELTGDLKEKLDEVLGREPAAGGDGASSDDFTGAREVDWSEFEERRRARQERRGRRRQKSRR
jgi:hypothetical protein